MLKCSYIAAIVKTHGAYALIFLLWVDIKKQKRRTWGVSLLYMPFPVSLLACKVVRFSLLICIESLKMNCCTTKRAHKEVGQTSRYWNIILSVPCFSLQANTWILHVVFNYNRRQKSLLSLLLLTCCDFRFFFKHGLNSHLPSLLCPLWSLPLCHAVVLAVFLPALHIDPALSPAAPLAISLQEYGCGAVGRGCTAD